MSRPRSASIVQGWAIDATHPNRIDFTPAAIISTLTNTCTPPSFDVQTYLQTHTTAIITHPNFNCLSPHSLRLLLSQPYLCCSEDQLLTSLISYVCTSYNVSPTHHSIWSDAQKIAIQSDIRSYIHLIRPHSLSMSILINLIEPLQLLNQRLLISTYRHHALHPNLHTHLSRPRAIVLQSSHPYTASAEQMEEASFPGADSILLEFDRRTHLPNDSHLSFFATHERDIPVATWQDWRTNRRGIKSCCIPSNFIAITYGMKRLNDVLSTQQTWGWKLILRPLFAATKNK